MRCPSCSTTVQDPLQETCPSCGSDLDQSGGALRTVALIEDALVGILLCGMILLVLVQIVLRDAFSTGITGGSEAVRHMVLWIAFLGAGLAAREGRHIRIDIAHRVLPMKQRAVLEILASAFTVGICAVLLWASVGFIRVDLETHTTILVHRVRVPVWTLETVIPLGYAMVMARYAITGTKKLRRLAAGYWG